MRRSAKAPVVALLVAAAMVAPIHAPWSSVARAESVAPYGACTGPTPKASQDAAKTLFGLGKKSYEQGNDVEAIKYWRDSFEKDCNATPMLLNLANAYQRAGSNDGAILSLETYLKREPTAEDAASIRSRIDNIKSKAKPLTTAAPTATTTALPPMSAAPPGTSTAPEPPPPPPVAPFNYVPWVVAGGGLVIGVVGGVLAIKQNGIKNDVKTKVDSSGVAKGPAGACTVLSTDPVLKAEELKFCETEQKESSSALKKARIFGVVGGVGGAMVVGGIIWGVMTLPKKGEAPSTISFVPQVGPGYSGFSYSGSF